MKEASIEAQRKQYEVLSGAVTTKKVGKHTYRIPFMTKWANWRISGYMVGQKFGDSKLSTNIGLMRESEKLQCRIIACALLVRWWKVLLFERIYAWILMNRLTEQEYGELMSVVVDRMGVGFFFQNIKTIENLNSLTRKMTKTELQSLFQAELK